MRLLRGSLLFLACSVPLNGLRIFTELPSPREHPLYSRHTVKPPELSLYATNASTLAPGFAAIRGLNSYAPQTWAPLIDLYMNETSQGGLGLANIVWPSYGIVFSPNWVELAGYLKARGIPAVDLGGFVPGGMNDYDVRTAEPNFTLGRNIMGESLLGLDMGEQDVRYLWGYAARSSTLLGPTSRQQQHQKFLDFSSNIELKAGARLMALSSTVFGVHHWLKTGLYTGAGSETSQSNGHAALLYAFVRGAAKQYGQLWFGQVSIYNWFGRKSYNGGNDTSCASQASASPLCGTSLSLMKRLMYTQLAYNSAFFAFEGELVYDSNSSVTPIGLLQQQTRAFFTAAAGAAPPGAPPLGVHVATVAVMLDSLGGWTRPCDTRPKAYTAASWGSLPWDAADALADAAFDEIFPGYRAGALLRNESGYITPTPYGDVMDVLLSDALLEVLGAYDTLVLAHRLVTEAGSVQARLGAFLGAGGTVLATASTLADLGGTLGGVTLGACSPTAPGTLITLEDGTQPPQLTEPLPFQLCALALPTSGVTLLATTTGPGGGGGGGGGGAVLPVAASVAVGNGTLLVLAAGGYGMALNGGNSSAFYSCGVDEPDSREGQPYLMLRHVRHFLSRALAAAAPFDLGADLAWVPQRRAPGDYFLTVTNPTLQEVPLGAIASPLGALASVAALPLPEGEKGALGYFPAGYQGINPGATTAHSIAGGDTVVLHVRLAGDGSSGVTREAARAAAARAALPALPPAFSRLLRLAQGGEGSIRRAVTARPGFEGAFSGVLVDWEYVGDRTEAALSREGEWLAAHNVSVAVDFTEGSTLFPGFRWVDDRGDYYAQGLSAVEGVLGKMGLLGARHALLALHGTSELPPANFSSDPVGLSRASALATLASLSTQAAALNITLHLRRSSRNDALAGPTLASQAAFAALAGLRIAPSLAYAQGMGCGGDAAGEAAAAFAGGAGARVLLVSAAWESYPGRAGESAALGGGAPPPPLSPGQWCQWLRSVHGAAVGAQGGGVVVMDADYNGSVEAEMGDVRALEACLAGQ